MADGSVRGFVRSAADVADLRRLAGEPGGPGALAVDVQVRAWPHCEVLQLLPDAQGGRAAVTLVGARPPLKPGAPLTLAIAGDRRDGYVQVDYFDSAGRVLHLLPGAAGSEHFVLAGDTVTVGPPTAGKASPGKAPTGKAPTGKAPTGRRALVVREPGGAQMITVVHSRRPLFAQARQETEPAERYIEALREAVAKLRPGDWTAAHLYLEVGP